MAEEISENEQKAEETGVSEPEEEEKKGGLGKLFVAGIIMGVVGVILMVIGIFISSGLTPIILYIVGTILAMAGMIGIIVGRFISG